MRKRRPSQLHSLLADLLLGLPPQLRQHYTRTLAPVQRQLAGVGAPTPTKAREAPAVLSHTGHFLRAALGPLGDTTPCPSPLH